MPSAGRADRKGGEADGVRAQGTAGRSGRGTGAGRGDVGPRLCRARRGAGTRGGAGLLDGDIVTFAIAGGPPKGYVWVKQCGPSASATTCDDATGRRFRVNPDGTYPLSPKKLYARLDTPAGTFDCRTAAAGGPCSLALTDSEGTVLTTVALRFRPDGRPEAPPTLRVTPDTGLVDGRTVRATGKGYEPQYHSLVMECAAGSADTLGCRPRSRPPASDDDGRIDEEVTLSATFTSIDGRTVDCRSRGACELVVFGSRVRGPESVRRPLEFAPAAHT
nr:neocarzinostatin apoprotein domain-containing protein [Streptomyces sp. NBC_00974]